MQLHPQEALLQQARALQQSEAFAEYWQRRVVVEHRLARRVQLGIRQSHYFGRAKTKFQLYLTATVANLTLVAAKAGRQANTDGGSSAGSALRAGTIRSALEIVPRGSVNLDPGLACVGPPERSLASVNVRASCSGEVSQRQAGSRLAGTFRSCQSPVEARWSRSHCRVFIPLCFETCVATVRDLAWEIDAVLRPRP